ncbi:MAG TPA: hypothetical protein VK427_02965, partial [Kofleriaceae bacterium]|nr:hypothetical protein [Kofleriaceae bacterium]
MRPLAAVLIARYQLARGRRDEAIATLTDRSEPWHAPAQLLVELDRLDAVDALAGTQDRLAWHELGPVARGLARRRRFDLLRPMLERPFAPPAQCGHLVWGALAGLWAAPATPDDTVLVRDWLLPVTVGAPHTRSECAQLLALVGDHVMARAIVDELREQRSITDGERIDQHTIVAPVLAALGDTHEASSLLAIALDLWAQLYVTSADRQGDTRRDALARAQARVRHLVRLAEHRALPWIGRGTVPTTFTSYEGDEHR